MALFKNEQSFTQHHFSHKSGAGFTLIELVIVIGILTILAVVVILAINPVEFLKQARDNKRLSELQNLNKAILLYRADGKSSFGSSSVVYVSIPDSLLTCGNLGLPSLPTGWEYRCSNSDNYRKVDSTGWVPVNFASVSYGAPLNILPIDPVNTTSSGQYYTYVTGGSWELTAVFESQRYRLGGSADKTSTDGGDSYGLLEIGSNLFLSPLKDTGLVGYWKFDEGSGTTASDSSGNSNTGTLTNGPTWISGKVAGALSFDGTDDWVSLVNSTEFDVDPGEARTLTAWFKGGTQLNGYGDILWKEGSCKGWSIFLYNYGGVSLRLNTGDISPGCTNMSYYTVTASDFAYNDNQWHYVVGIINRPNSNLQIYIDGKSKGSVAIDNTKAGAGGSARIGTVWNNTYYFNGLIDDVRIYNRALSAAEIQAIYNATK